MPELPEVEIVKRGLEPVLSGNKVLNCVLNIKGLRYPFGDDFVSHLHNMSVRSTARRGKYILIDFENDKTLVWHLGMSGKVKIYSNKNDYGPEKHDHVLLYMGADEMIVYNDPRRFGFLEFVKTSDIETSRHFAKMGPEPLGNHFNGDIFYQAIKNKKTTIKAALLDQRVVAGVGNIYACEALYMSRISPLRLASSLTKDEAESLAAAIKSVLIKAIEAGGSTLKDYAHTDGSLGYFQHMFGVYDREGKACPDCDCNLPLTHGIKRVVQSGRSTFYCPNLQK